MKIWRVEDSIGRGCYRPTQNTEHILSRHKNEMTHPTPLQDRFISRNPKGSEISGFASEKQARDWFSDLELNVLKHMGFKLKEVEVSKITVYGDFQVLAIKNENSSFAKEETEEYGLASMFPYSGLML